MTSMVLPATGTISLLDVQGEFGGANPIGINEYYSGGAYVGATVGGVPSGGVVSLGDFLGKSAITGVTDNLTAAARGDIVAMYGFKLLKGAYSGAVVAVRRGSDNVVADFYASTSGVLGTGALGTGTSLSTWLGGASGFVQTWYDQSGRGKHAAQATAASQPTILQSGGETYAYLTSTRTLRGGNIFDTATISDMHMVFASKEVTRVDNFLISLDGANVGGDRRFSAHTPWSSGVWYFDPGNAIENRCASASGITTVGVRNVFSGYKSTTEGKNGFRVNQGTRYLSTSNSAGNVSGGIALNLHESTAIANHYLYNLVVFKSKLGATDETYMESNI